MRSRFAARRGARGAIVPLTAMAMVILVLSVAFAIDLGRLASERRSMQADADVIALDLARLADGQQTEMEIKDSAQYADVLARSADANGVDPTESLKVEYGIYDPATDAFDDAGEPPNAVRVTASNTIDYHFATVAGFDEGSTQRTAIAALDAVAGFQVGSRLLSIDPGQASILDRVFTQALGESPELNAVGYQGLLNARIPLRRLAIDLVGGSPDQLAGATVEARRFYLVAADIMEAPPQSNTAAATALRAIAADVDSNVMLKMDRLMRIDQGGETAAANASLDLFSLVTGSAFAIDGVNTFSIPSLNIGVGGASTNVSVTVIEKPRFAFGPVGTSVNTQQASVDIVTQLANVPIDILGLAGARVSGTIPISLSLAGATGTLDSIDCKAPSISVGLEPQPVTVEGGMDLAVSARVLFATIPVASVTVPFDSPIAVSGTSAGASFLYPDEFLPDVGSGAMKPARTATLDLDGGLASAEGDVQVSLAGLLSLNVSASINTHVVEPVTAGVSQLITNQLDRLLGLDIGGADLGAIDMDCTAIKLVA